MSKIESVSKDTMTVLLHSLNNDHVIELESMDNKIKDLKCDHAEKIR